MMTSLPVGALLMTTLDLEAPLYHAFVDTLQFFQTSYGWDPYLEKGLMKLIWRCLALLKGLTLLLILV